MIRSLLFAGAGRPDLVAKLAGTDADVVVIDLEDAVPASDKDAARGALPELVESAAGARVLVRVNGAATPWFVADVEAVTGLPVAGVVLPKAERPEEVAELAGRLGEEATLVVGLESARGVAAAAELLAAGATSGYFGAEDYIADLGGRRTAAGAEVLYARSQVALAARLAGVPCLDQVVVDFREDAAFEADAEAGRALGYRGKLCIHPRQASIANRVFGATPEELRRARDLLAAWERAAADGVGAISFDGAMVDVPAVRMARDTIERAG
jgi:citrate lyase subunit beta / citryl-CoA lyase